VSIGNLVHSRVSHSLRTRGDLSSDQATGISATTIDEAELGRRLGTYMTRARNGEQFVVLRDGEPIARMIGIEPRKPPAKAMISQTG
jgi:hypothetical protein